MNEIIQSLFSRKSVRAYTDRKITQDDKVLILEAASQAPSAGNQQLYTILDITDQKLKETLAVTCDHQPFIAKGQLVLIFCADFHKWYQGFQLAGCHPRTPSVGDLFLAVEDASIAAQNAVTAAQSLGIGSCYIGDIMEHYEKHRELLNLPNFVFPAVMAVFGYPTPQQERRPKPSRASLDFLVHENTYPCFTHKDLMENLSKTSESRAFQDYMQAFCKRKYHSDFSAEMDRSVKKMLEQFYS